MLPWITASLAATLRIGSKMDTEGHLLAELFAQVAEAEGEAVVERRFGLGGTGIVLAALEGGEIDLFPEYSGTLTHAVLHEPTLTDPAVIRARMEAAGWAVGPSLGFNNTYALGMTRARAEALGVRTISDLAGAPTLRGAFSPEFLEGEHGLSALQAAYGFQLADRSIIEHSIAYGALAAGAIDLTDLYTTDAEIARMDLVALVDDRAFFPRYEGLALARGDVPKRFPRTWAALQRLGGTLDDATMTRLNGRVALDKEAFSTVAADVLGAGGQRRSRASELGSQLARLTLEHAGLVGAAVALSAALGVPLGVVASRAPRFGAAVIAAAGVLQTVPTVALLCFLVPLLGIGSAPALVALVTYGLLPIVQGTLLGLQSVDRACIEAADALAMSARSRLRYIELPLAMPAILAGIQIAAVTSVGTATLAALIGGGGYGTLILSGLGLRDNTLLLAGAVPSALMAVALHGLFGLLRRVLIPRGLR